MKNIKYWIMGLAIALLGLRTGLAAGETDAKNTERIGVYDSRVVAYAYFWTDENQQKLQEQMAAAKAAKKAGEKEQFEKLSAALKELQQTNHRQVFGAAPAVEALAALKPHIAEIQKEAGVTALVSKWDAKGLKQYTSASQVDITDVIVGKFIKPTEKQLKVIEDIKKRKPVPADKIAD